MSNLDTDALPLQLDFFDILDRSSSVDSSIGFDKWSNLTLLELNEIHKSFEEAVSITRQRLLEAQRFGDDMQNDYRDQLEELDGSIVVLRGLIESKSKIVVSLKETKGRVKKQLKNKGLAELDFNRLELLSKVDTEIMDAITLYWKVLVGFGDARLDKEYENLSSLTEPVDKLVSAIKFGYGLIAILHRNKNTGHLASELLMQVDFIVEKLEELMYSMVMHDKNRYNFSFSEIKEKTFANFAGLQSKGRITENQEEVLIPYHSKKANITFEARYTGSGYLYMIGYFSPNFGGNLYWRSKN